MVCSVKMGTWHPMSLIRHGQIRHFNGSCLLSRWSVNKAFKSTNARFPVFSNSVVSLMIQVFWPLSLWFRCNRCQTASRWSYLGSHKEMLGKMREQLMSVVAAAILGFVVRDGRLYGCPRLIPCLRDHNRIVRYNWLKFEKSRRTNPERASSKLNLPRRMFVKRTRDILRQEDYVDKWKKFGCHIIFQIIQIHVTW